MLLATGLGALLPMILGAAAAAAGTGVNLFAGRRYADQTAPGRGAFSGRSFIGDPAGYGRSVGELLTDADVSADEAGWLTNLLNTAGAHGGEAYLAQERENRRALRGQRQAVTGARDRVEGTLRPVVDRSRDRMGQPGMTQDEVNQIIGRISEQLNAGHRAAREDLAESGAARGLSRSAVALNDSRLASDVRRSQAESAIRANIDRLQFNRQYEADAIRDAAAIADAYLGRISPMDLGLASLETPVDFLSLVEPTAERTLGREAELAAQRAALGNIILSAGTNLFNAGYGHFANKSLQGTASGGGLFGDGGGAALGSVALPWADYALSAATGVPINPFLFSLSAPTGAALGGLLDRR